MSEVEETFNSDTSFEHLSKKCNWCNGYKRLVPGQKCCKKCLDGAYRVCKRCKRPFPNNDYFQLDAERCTSCYKKLTKERLRREQIKKNKTAEKSSKARKKVPKKITKQKKTAIQAFFLKDGGTTSSNKRKAINVDRHHEAEPKRKLAKIAVEGPVKSNTSDGTAGLVTKKGILKMNKEPLYMEMFRICESLPDGIEKYYFAFPVHSQAGNSVKVRDSENCRTLPEKDKTKTQKDEDAKKMPGKNVQMSEKKAGSSSSSIRDTEVSKENSAITAACYQGPVPLSEAADNDCESTTSDDSQASVSSSADEPCSSSSEEDEDEEVDVV